VNDGRVVDSHVHAGGSYAPLAQTWPLLDAAGVTHVVLVQQFDLYDNSELLAESGDDRVLEVIVGVDLGDPQASVVAAGLLGHPKVRGIRLPRTGSWEQPADPQLWPVLDEHAAVVSVPPMIERIANGDAARIAHAHPNVRVRVEHLGGTTFAEIDVDDRRFHRVLALATHANVTVTWSGFFLNASGGFPYAVAHPHLRASCRAFGSERISWSGDVNRPALAVAEYERERRLFDELDWLAPAERRRIFANTP
jgi:predicted TIM-barrel fold metal-dependent hydrolase